MSTISLPSEPGIQLVDEQYQLQGLDLLQLAQQHGAPLFVYDGAMIRHKYESLLHAFRHFPCKIKYPVKALSSLAVLQYLKKLGAGLDTVSIQEVELGILAGFRPDEIIFTPNCVSIEEISMAVEMGVMINIDNISILEQFGNLYGGSVPCCIRFNPHIAAGGNSKIQVGHIDSKFGISVFQRRHVQRIIDAHGIHVVGLHVHTGSDILNANAYLQSAEIMFDLAREFKELQFIDFGSGFKVGYKENDVVSDVNEIGEKLAGSYRQFVADYGREVELWFEPGKFLVSESGFFLMKVNVIKPTPATVFVGVDSGLNHFIRPMMYGGYHDILNVSNPNGTTRIYTVVGYICETDTFGSDRKIAEVKEGDILALKNAGAYGFTMSSNYNSRFRPAEVLILDGKAHLIRKRETMEDLTRNQFPLEL